MAPHIGAAIPARSVKKIKKIAILASTDVFASFIASATEKIIYKTNSATAAMTDKSPMINPVVNFTVSSHFLTSNI